MKFKVTMKDPDTLHDAIQEAVKAEVNKLQGLSEEEGQELIESRTERVAEECRRWFEYGEYLTVEVDTEAKTCVVLPKG